jgi:hypothetical protein
LAASATAWVRGITLILRPRFVGVQKTECPFQCLAGGCQILQQFNLVVKMNQEGFIQFGSKDLLEETYRLPPAPHRSFGARSRLCRPADLVLAVDWSPE